MGFAPTRLTETGTQPTRSHQHTRFLIHNYVPSLYLLYEVQIPRYTIWGSNLVETYFLGKFRIFNKTTKNIYKQAKAKANKENYNHQTNQVYKQTKATKLHENTLPSIPQRLPPSLRNSSFPSKTKLSQINILHKLKDPLPNFMSITTAINNKRWNHKTYYSS